MVSLANKCLTLMVICNYKQERATNAKTKNDQKRKSFYG
jgi:hypothetical protein